MQIAVWINFTYTVTLQKYRLKYYLIHIKFQQKSPLGIPEIFPLSSHEIDRYQHSRQLFLLYRLGFELDIVRCSEINVLNSFRDA